MAYGAIVGQSPDTTKIEQKIGNIEKNYVPKSGTTMTGALNMGNHKVSGVANGTDSGDAVNKGQLDEVKNSAASVPFVGSGLTLLQHWTGYLEDDTTVYSSTWTGRNKIFILGYFFADYTDTVLLPVCGCLRQNDSIGIPILSGATVSTGDADVGFNLGAQVYVSNRGSHGSMVNFFDIYIYEF